MAWLGTVASLMGGKKKTSMTGGDSTGESPIQRKTETSTAEAPTDAGPAASGSITKSDPQKVAQGVDDSNQAADTGKGNTDWGKMAGAAIKMIGSKKKTNMSGGGSYGGMGRFG